MLKIGDFSKLSRISIRMLRHYDTIGLLIPSSVDSSTGYRYYKETQLVDAACIQTLKSMGFSIAAMEEILQNYNDVAELEHFLLIQKKELESKTEELHQQCAILDNTLQWIRKDGNIMEYNVTLKTLPKRYAATVRQVIPAYDREGTLWQIMMKETAQQNLQQASPCYALAVFHDKEYKEHDVEVEVQLSVSGTYEDTEHVKFKDIAPVQMVSATFKGGYEQIVRVNQSVADWVLENGYDYDGASFWIYHVGPGKTQNPEEYVTEICYPVKLK